MSNTKTNLSTQTSSVLHNDTVSSCSTSKVQEKTQLSKEGCMKSLRAIQSQFKFLTDTLQDFGTMPIFKRTFAQDFDLLEQHLTKEIISQTDCKTILTKLRTTLENAFNSEFKERIHKYTRFDAQSFKDAMIYNMDSIGKYIDIILHQQRTPHLLKQKIFIQNTCSEKEDTNSETAYSKSVKESSLNYETKDVHAIKYKMSKAKERCMAYFRSLHSHLQVLSKDDLKGTHIEHGFKRAFMSLFGQDVDTFTRTMLLNFQKFIDSKFTLDYDSQMADTYFVEYTGIAVKHFRDTLLQHLGNVKKSVAERTRHQRQYERRVNKRQMQTQEKSDVQDDNSRSGNDTDADDTYIKHIYDKEPMAEVGLTTLKSGQHGKILNETSNKAKIEKEIDVLETMNIELEHSVAKLRKKNKTLKQHYKDLHDSIKITRSKTTEQTTSLLANNVELKAQIQEKVFAIATTKQTTSLLANNVELKAQIQEKVFAIAALKNDLRKLKGNSVDTKFAKTSVLGKLVLQSLRNQSVVRQPNAFKSERT
ncbi:hypothetical protein Tco_0282749 [Tanacetum coccineum]